MRKSLSKRIFFQEIHAAHTLIDSAKKISRSHPTELGQTTLILGDTLLHIAQGFETRKEQRESRWLARFVKNPSLKWALVLVTDRLFRSPNPITTKELLLEKTELFSNLKELTWWQQTCIRIGLLSIRLIPSVTIPILRTMVRSKMNRVIFEKNDGSFFEFLASAEQKGFLVNVNRLGEAILGEQEAKKRLRGYLEDIQNPLIHGISIKLSSLFSNITPLSFREKILPRMREKLTLLLDTSIKTGRAPLLTIDMEEFRDLYITQELVCDIALHPDTLQAKIGIALQAYIPDSYRVMKEVIRASKKRVELGGRPLYIRLVKGANLLMEQLEAHIKNWPQAPFSTKNETDTHYLRLMKELFLEAQSGSIHIGIATHNIFDMSYALLLASSYNVESSVWYEMLSGMAPALSRALKEVSKNRLVLYCPVAEKEEIASTIAYLIRRLDENAQPGHFLPALSQALVGDISRWKPEKEKFLQSCEQEKDLFLPQTKVPYSLSSQLEILHNPDNSTFINCPDVDWSQPENRMFGEKLRDDWLRRPAKSISPILHGTKAPISHVCTREDPSRPNTIIHSFGTVDKKTLLEYLETASQKHISKKTSGWTWSIEDRIRFLHILAEKIERKRFDFIGMMLQEISKPIPEGDAEVSEAVDFCRYYATLLQNEKTFCSWKSGLDVAFVASPWNFPLSLSLQHILQGLLSGHTVLYKPAMEAVGVGELLTLTILEAGLDPSLLAFIPLQDAPEGTELLQSHLIDTLFVTGSTQTGRFFMKTAHTKRIFAETGGKNVAYLSAKSDVDLALRDIIRSAFSFSGQKCSALSVLIVEKDLLDSHKFLAQLKDAAESLIVDSAWNLSATVVPLATNPSHQFLKAIQTLDIGERWLVPPTVSEKNPRLYAPSIKILENPGTFSHMNELFGPSLSVIPAYDIQDALRVAHMTSYGLTSGIYTLSDDEARIWKNQIQTGMVYINRPLVGALVSRQPFGGWKGSSFGIGMKVGGPFSLRQLQTTPTHNPDLISEKNCYAMSGRILSLLSTLIPNPESKSVYTTCISWSQKAFNIWKAEFSRFPQTCSHIPGQINELYCMSREEIILYAQEGDSPIMIWACIAMAAIASTKVYLPATAIDILTPYIDKDSFLASVRRMGWIVIESPQDMIELLQKIPYPRIKALQPIQAHDFEKYAREMAYMIDEDPLSLDPRIDFLYFIREKTVSHDIHRYGNIIDEGVPKAL